MFFKNFIEDEDRAEAKRKEIEKVILKVVKKNLSEKPVTTEDGTTTIKFKAQGPLDAREMDYTVVVTVDYTKKVYKGTIRTIFINVAKESETTRETDYIAIDIDAISDPHYAKTLDSIREYYKKIVDNG